MNRKTRWLLFIPLIAIFAIAPTACHHGYYGAGRGFNPEERYERSGPRHSHGHAHYRNHYERPYRRYGYHGWGWGFSGYYGHYERRERHYDRGRGSEYIEHRHIQNSRSTLERRETRDRERAESND
ncbi:MAG: hypothetical protein AAF585_29915 [Verrucomicrobiota bacterium]